MHNPTLEDFLRCARQEFHFLVVESGFREQALPKRLGGNPYEVRYRNGTTLVIVEGVNWVMESMCYSVQDDSRFYARRYIPTLADLKLRRPDLHDRLAIGDQLAQLSSWAVALRESAEDVLIGDFSIRAEAEKVTKDTASALAAKERADVVDWRYRTDIEKATEAFRTKDYPSVVAILIEHEARLTRHSARNWNTRERSAHDFSRTNCSSIDIPRRRMATMRVNARAIA